MTTVAAIRRTGFRKWYERELLQGHLHLILLVMCAVAILGSAEALSSRAPGSSPLTMLLCAVVSVVVGVWALRRYLFLLGHAEYLADQAVCSACGTYARWDIVGEEPQEVSMQVCCRGCGHRWRIGL